MTWGNQFRGGMGQMGQMGGMGGMGGQTSYGKSQWNWPGQQQQPGILQQAAPWGQVLSSLVGGLWGPDAQRVNMEREFMEEEQRRYDASQQSGANKINWAQQGLRQLARRGG